MKQQNPKTGGVQKKPTPFADESILVTGTLPETSGFDRVGHVIIGGVPLPPGRLGVGGGFSAGDRWQAASGRWHTGRVVAGRFRQVVAALRCRGSLRRLGQPVRVATGTGQWRVARH